MVVACCVAPKERPHQEAVPVEVISYAPVEGYSFRQSPAVFSISRHDLHKAIQPVPATLADSISISPAIDSALLEADEVSPTYEDAPFFVITTDSAFQSMLVQGVGKMRGYDSALTPVNFQKEFLIVLYAPPAALTDASASLSVNSVVPDAGVLYVTTSSYYSIPADSARQASPFWQVAMYKVERRQFSRVGIVAEDTTYFGL